MTDAATASPLVENDLLLHMLGLTDADFTGSIPPRSRRNYFAADPESDDDLALALMADAGLVRRYRTPTAIYPYNVYAATDAGRARIRATCGAFCEGDEL